MNYLELKYIQSHLKKREPFSNKGDYGHALIIAGKKGYMGAAVIASKACIRSGVGLLTVSVPSEERFILQTTVPEAMLLMREDDQDNFKKFTAVGIGPGMGIDAAAEELLLKIMTTCKTPLVLDADALTIISHNKELFNKIPEHTMITPHAGEFDRLFGKHKNNEERVHTAAQQAKEYRIIIVLKGHHTAIISPEKISYNTTGNAGLAKGGSGDALTGVITSFLAQGYSTSVAAEIAVYLHGLAADITLQSQSMESMIITDVIDYFADAFKEICQ
ncbi:MAG TPA: NAD(P)H-hydrate dehydratase [Ferruginibacter sp.]|nr:NAD(P)H-hydrate dehydratase [Niastella sp.]HRB31317.1 NAD(P)H-hydrate dehydratase [Ferruginibacter sp.]